MQKNPYNYFTGYIKKGKDFDGQEHLIGESTTQFVG